MLKQVNSLTAINAFICLGGFRETHQTAVQNFSGCCCCRVLAFVLYCLSWNFEIPFAMLIHLIYLIYCNFSTFIRESRNGKSIFNRRKKQTITHFYVKKSQVYNYVLHSPNLHRSIEDDLCLTFPLTKTDKQLCLDVNRIDPSLARSPK